MSHCDSYFIFVCFQLALLLVWAAEKQPKFEDPLLKGGGGKSELYFLYKTWETNFANLWLGKK
jgi:hypothetical protein